jgi:hypothetical protein
MTEGLGSGAELVDEHKPAVLTLFERLNLNVSGTVLK